MTNKIRRNKGAIKHPGKYPVKWCINGLELEGSENLGHLGICGYSRNVAFLDGNPNPAQLIEIRDIFIKNGDCSNSEHCLDLKCKYNKTTGHSFVKTMAASEKEGVKIINGFDLLVQITENISNKIKKHYTHLLDFNAHSMFQCNNPVINTSKKTYKQFKTLDR